MDISKLLSCTSHSINSDKNLFKKWESKQITTNEAIRDFKINNNIEEEIGETEFVLWMNSIGWSR